MSIEIWFCPSSTGIPATPKIGPGDIPRDPTAEWPWDVLKFAAGYLEVETEDAHYPEWRRWLDLSAPGLGLKIVTAEERAAIEAPLTMTDAQFEALAARRASRR
jgi:hypothetical protein